MKRDTHARTSDVKTHPVTCDCKQCKLKRLNQAEHLQKVAAVRSEIGDLVHCDSIISKTPSVKHKYTGAHNFLDHASRFAMVCPFKKRAEIRTVIPDLCQYFSTRH